MKTKTSVAGKITQVSSMVAGILIHTTQQIFRYIIARYIYPLLYILTLISCQQNLVQTDAVIIKSKDSISIVQPTPVTRFILIDTFLYSMNDRVVTLSKDHSDFTKKIQDKVIHFYTANGNRTKWLAVDAPTDMYEALKAHFKNSYRHGLNPEDYTLEWIDEKLAQVYQTKPLTRKDIIDLDILITKTFFLFSTHLTEGRISNPGNSKYLWIREITKDGGPDITSLINVNHPHQLQEIVDNMQPTHEQYGKLQKALDFYRQLEGSSFTMLLPMRAGEKIKPEERHLAIPLIRKKLSSIDLQAYTTPDDDNTNLQDSLHYDHSLLLAVKAFQERHGLESDGVIGEKTIKYLNQSINEKAELIALNMERIRWSWKNYGDTYIVVNIPEYKLRIYENKQQTLEMNVIVGAVHKPTPVFNEILEHIVFSPTWTVPPSIMKEEMFPRLKKDSMYYDQRDFTFYKNGIKINPSTEQWDSAWMNTHQYRIVQQPGPENALGLVKFVMPNSLNIYLHDTPDHSLFTKNYRALSHGCIRLSQPARLAEYVLRNQKGWDLQMIDKAMAVNKPTTVHLQKHYPVHIEYHTAWVDDHGQLHFREDIYGHDKRQLQQLKPVKKVVTTIATLQ